MFGPKFGDFGDFELLKKVLTGLHDSCSWQIDCYLAFIV